MQSRRDQVQAQGYVNGRMVNALLTAQPDAPEPPHRRTTVGLFSGLAVGALIAAGFGVFGLFVPGGDDGWRKPGVVVLEKESGTRYVYDGQWLHPVYNDASARLLLGGGAPIVRVSRRSLDGVAHGRPVGIVGAPDPVPARDRLIRDDWHVCAGSATDATGRPRPAVVLSVGNSAAAPAPDDAALVARLDGERYLVWQGQRMRIRADWIPAALALDARPATPVTAAWLNALAAGPDLHSPSVPGRGAAGPRLDGRDTRLGQVFVVRSTGAADRRYVLRGDGLAPLSDFDAALLLADPATRAAYPGQAPAELPLSVNAQAGQPVAMSGAEPGRPSRVPVPLALGSGQIPCVRVGFGAADAVAKLSTMDASVLPATRPAPGAGIAADARVADRVAVAPGAGVLARPLVAPGVAGNASYLVTDTGVKYPVASEDDLAALGFDGVPAVPVPPALLTLLPTGPALDATAAAFSPG
jgi:type VII secretion protein EccB